MTTTNKIKSHGESEGRADYLGRAQDVARGAESPEWAWPYVDADEAYLNAVGVGTICRSLGIETSAWGNVCEEWCEAFRRGYEAAHTDAHQSMIAVVGDGGLYPVVWGLGKSVDEALADARDSDVDNVGWDSLGWAEVEVDSSTVARIRAGEVNCRSLGINVRCDRDGRIVDAEVE